MAGCSRIRALVLALTGLAATACEPERQQAGEQRTAVPPAGGDAAAAPAELTCSDPVRPADTAASLLERYGAEARRETLYGAEGVEIPGLVLWPDDPARRLEVSFMDEGTPAVSSVEPGPGSSWRVAGLRIGDPLVRANAANGRPFRLWGFGWDYGGYASDLHGGRLAALPGGCRVIVRLAPREDAVLADDLSGEIEVSSDDPRLEALGVTIDELALAF